VIIVNAIPERRPSILRRLAHAARREAQKRFGATVTAPSQALLERIVELTVLEELGEALLDCADGEAWLALLVRRVGG
jgi:hypothetical protein